MLPLLMLMLLAVPAPGEDATIVVTARSLADTERDLAECLARQCPPREDIEASLAHGENLFLAGEFAQARAVLGKARNRNLRFAATLPVEVSDLVRAYGRLSSFDGYDGLGRSAQIDSLDALKAGLDSGDARILLQRLLVGDEFARVGRLVAAEDVYATVEKQARKAGLPRVLGFAMLRQAVMFGAIASVAPQYRPEARARIARLERTTAPELAPFRDAVGLLKVRLAAVDGDDRAIDAAIETIARNHAPARPLLVYAPPIDLDPAATGGSSLVAPVGSSAPQWIDIAFDIDADGRVRTVETVRQSDMVSGAWPDRVRDALTRRRYTPPAAGAERHVERFALVYNVTSTTGTRLRSRSPVGRIVTLDLTVDPDAGDSRGG
jgi:hypothetical protein